VTSSSVADTQIRTVEVRKRASCFPEHKFSSGNDEDIGRVERRESERGSECLSFFLSIRIDGKQRSKTTTNQHKDYRVSMDATIELPTSLKERK
jgi:hypothetical protein